MPTYVGSSTNNGAYSGSASLTWSGATGDPQTVLVILFPEVGDGADLPTGWSFSGADVASYEVVEPPPGWFAGHTIYAYRVEVEGTAGSITATADDHGADIDWLNWETLTFEDVTDIASGGGIAVEASTTPMMLPGFDEDVPADSILVAACVRAFRNPTFTTPDGWTQRATGNNLTACTIAVTEDGPVADLEVDVTDPFGGDGFAGVLIAVMPEGAPPTAPGQVTGLDADAGDAQVELTWALPTSGGSPITDYVIERAPDDGGSPGSWSTISDGTSTTRSYLDTDVVNDSTYWYRVSAVNAVGTGTASTPVSATPAVPEPPVGPTLRGTSTTSAVAAGALTVALPSGTQLTDTVVLVVATDHSAATTFTAPGMTEVVDVDNLGTNPIQFAVLAGTGLSGSVIVTPSDPLAWLEVAVMSWILGDPELIVGTPATSDGTTTNLGGVTTVDPDTPVLVVACQNFASAPSTTPETTSVVTVGGGAHGRVLTTGVQDDAGATGNVSITWAVTGRSSAAVMLAIPTGEPPPPEPKRTVRTAGGGLWRGPNGGELRMAGAPPPAGDRFDVWNGRIRYPDGRIFYPVGMNTAIKITEYPYVYEYNAFNSGTISSYEHDPVTWPSHVAEAQAWGLNFLRINTIVVNDDPEGPNPGQPALLADLIEHGVNELLDAGFVVMVTSHDFTGTENETILGTATDLAVKSFYSACIAKWGDNPRFWINPYNEPYAWGPESLTYWHELFEGAVDFLRGEGYTGPIVCDIPRYAQGIDVLASGALDEFATYDPGIVFGWHAYGVASEFPPNTWETHEELAAAVRARGHAVLIGECGVANPPSAGDGPWEFNEVGFGWCMDRARFYGWGFVWWHSVHPTYTIRLDDAPFWTSIDGTGLTPSGEAFWEFAHGTD